MTERLYYDQPELTEFEASVMSLSDDGRRAYLDRTAFYPASGGQPFDTGTLGGIAVVDVVDEGDTIAHVTASPLPLGPVRGLIDRVRRRDHMQQHSGQHLLSAAFIDVLAAETVSFHLGEDASTIDLGIPALSAEDAVRVERRANELVMENRPISIAYEHASQAEGLRKASEREGTLRIITIQDLDRSACGGTHVKATGEIGPILIRKLEKIRGNVRVEFLCGGRAVTRARADYDALARIARSFTASLDEAPALVAAQNEKLAEADKARRRLATELAELRGRELYAATPAGPDGLKRVEYRGDDLRVLAQSFCAGSKAVFIGLSDNPPTILVAASKDSGYLAGERLKTALAAVGGRGGGNAQLAQGSVPSAGALTRAAALLRS